MGFVPWLTRTWRRIVVRRIWPIPFVILAVCAAALLQPPYLWTATISRTLWALAAAATVIWMVRPRWSIAHDAALIAFVGACGSRCIAQAVYPSPLVWQTRILSILAFGVLGFAFAELAIYDQHDGTVRRKDDGGGDR